MALGLVYQDTFTRTVANGWDGVETARWLTPVYDGVTFAGGNAGCDGSHGTITITPGSAGRLGQALDLGSTDGEVLAASALDTVPVGTSSLVQQRILFRIQDATNFYGAGWYVNPAGAVKTRIRTTINGTSANLDIDHTVTASGYTGGDLYWIRVNYTGTTLKLRVWKDGTAEPGTWQVNLTDSTFTGGTTFALSTTGNGSTTASCVGLWDSFTASRPGSTTAPTLGTVLPGQTLLGIHPDGLTKFWKVKYDGAGFGSESLNSALLQREVAIGRTIDSAGAYVSWGEWTGALGADDTGNIKLNLANIINGGRNCVLSFWELTGAPDDWKAGTVAGAYDSVYTDFADYLVSLNPAAWQILLRLSWEMNLSNWGTDPAGFIAYWRYVVTLMRTRDPSNLLKWFWCPSGSGTPLWTDFYPGDSYVDVIGQDKYNGAPFADLKTIWTQTANANPSNSNFYQTFLSHGKPYVHGETNSREQDDPTLNSHQPTTKAQWFRNIRGVATDLPNLKMITFWDKQGGSAKPNPNQPDYHLDTVPDQYGVYDPTGANPTWAEVASLFYAAEFNRPVITKRNRAYQKNGKLRLRSL